MTADNVGPRRILGLADSPDDRLRAAPWIGGFVALGSLLRRYLPKLDGRQLVLTVSVPRRDYAAALIGAGWMISSPPPKLADPIEVFRKADSSKFLRGVTDQLIVAGRFSKLMDNRPDVRVRTGEKLLPVERYKAVAELDEEVLSTSDDVPQPGILGDLSGASETWLERLASPPGDLALIGTAKRLQQDLATLIGDSAEVGSEGTPLNTYVLSRREGAATWSTPIVPSARFEEGQRLPDACRTVILDRYAAIKYLNDITVPIVVCVVDRSVADESAAEMILESRRSNSQPVSVISDLGWQPPRAVEALAFTVAL